MGVEQKNGKVCVLLFDPGRSSADMRKLLSPADKSSLNHLRRFPSHLKHQQYQVVVVQGVLSQHDKQVNTPPPNMTLSPF